MPEDSHVRLNKFLASCGIGSRRSVEKLILEGLVTVDGRTVSSLGTTVSPKSVVSVDGERVSPESFVYMVFNKPEGVVCSQADSHNVTIYDAIPALGNMEERIFSIGRLDKDSTGLLVLTNDGDLAHTLGHPSHGVSKSYEVLLANPLSEKDLMSWRQGVLLDGKKRVPLFLEYMQRNPEKKWLSLGLQEGLKREIRRMAQHYHNKVIDLKRVALGKLSLKKLLPGEFQMFSKEELWCMIYGGGSV